MSTATYSLLATMIGGRLLIALLGLIAVRMADSTCIAPYVPVGGKCLFVEFSFEQGGMTWQEARDYCKMLGTEGLNPDLASFPTCDEYTEFARYLALNAPTTNHSFWVGAHTLFSPNMWEWVTLESLQTGVPFWSEGEEYPLSNTCAAADGNHYFRLATGDCTETKGIACSYTPEVVQETPEIYTLEEVQETFKASSKKSNDEEHGCPSYGIIVGDFCYTFSSHEEYYSSAESKCKHDYSDHHGELFYPTTCEEFSNMAHHLEASESLKAYWVGAIDVSGMYEWTWVSGLPVPSGPPFWASGEPNHTPKDAPRDFCAIMSPDSRYYLQDVSCHTRHRYICKLNMIE